METKRLFHPYPNFKHYLNRNPKPTQRSILGERIVDGHLTMITQEGEVRMQTPLCGRGQEEWIPALRDVIETNRSMGGADPSIAFVDNPVADHKCLCETVEGIKTTQVFVRLESCV
jgi:hypothetical protein